MGAQIFTQLVWGLTEDLREANAYEPPEEGSEEGLDKEQLREECAECVRSAFALCRSSYKESEPSHRSLQDSLMALIDVLEPAHSPLLQVIDAIVKYGADVAAEAAARPAPPPDAAGAAPARAAGGAHPRHSAFAARAAAQKAERRGRTAAGRRRREAGLSAQRQRLEHARGVWNAALKPLRAAHWKLVTRLEIPEKAEGQHYVSDNIRLSARQVMIATNAILSNRVSDNEKVTTYCSKMDASWAKDGARYDGTARVEDMAEAAPTIGKSMLTPQLDHLLPACAFLYRSCREVGESLAVTETLDRIVRVYQGTSIHSVKDLPPSYEEKRKEREEEAKKARARFGDFRVLFPHRSPKSKAPPAPPAREPIEWPRPPPKRWPDYPYHRKPGTPYEVSCVQEMLPPEWAHVSPFAYKIAQEMVQRTAGPAKGIIVALPTGTGKTHALVMAAICTLSSLDPHQRALTRIVVVESARQVIPQFKADIDSYGKLSQAAGVEIRVITRRELAGAFSESHHLHDPALGPSPFESVFKNSFLIIDEAHNMRKVSPREEELEDSSAAEGKFSAAAIWAASLAKWVLLATATPFVNFVSDLVPLYLMILKPEYEVWQRLSELYLHKGAVNDQYQSLVEGQLARLLFGPKPAPGDCTVALMPPSTSRLWDEMQGAPQKPVVFSARLRLRMSPAYAAFATFQRNSASMKEAADKQAAEAAKAAAARAAAVAEGAEQGDAVPAGGHPAAGGHAAQGGAPARRAKAKPKPKRLEGVMGPMPRKPKPYSTGYRMTSVGFLLPPEQNMLLNFLLQMCEHGSASFETDAMEDRVAGCRIAASEVESALGDKRGREKVAAKRILQARIDDMGGRKFAPAPATRPPRGTIEQPNPEYNALISAPVAANAPAAVVDAYKNAYGYRGKTLILATFKNTGVVHVLQTLLDAQLDPKCNWRPAFIGAITGSGGIIVTRRVGTSRHPVPDGLVASFTNEYFKTDELNAIKDEFNRFNTEDDVVLITSAASQEGLHFTGIRTVISIDPKWNLAGEQQALGRAARYNSGQAFVAIYQLSIGGGGPEHAHDAVQLVASAKQKKYEEVVSKWLDRANLLDPENECRLHAHERQLPAAEPKNREETEAYLAKFYRALPKLSKPEGSAMLKREDQEAAALGAAIDAAQSALTAQSGTGGPAASAGDTQAEAPIVAPSNSRAATRSRLSAVARAASKAAAPTPAPHVAVPDPKRAALAHRGARAPGAASAAGHAAAAREPRRVSSSSSSTTEMEAPPRKRQAGASGPRAARADDPRRGVAPDRAATPASATAARGRAARPRGRRPAAHRDASPASSSSMDFFPPKRE